MVDRQNGPKWAVHDDLVIDYRHHAAYLDGKAVNLTPTEFKILTTLAKAGGAPVTREQLMLTVWGHTWFARDDHLAAHIHRIRSQLHDTTPTPRFIQTVRGVGYRFGTPEMSPAHTLAVTALTRLDNLVADSPNFYTLTNEHGIIDWVSSSIQNALGRDATALIGTPLDDHATPKPPHYVWRNIHGDAAPYSPNRQPHDTTICLTLWSPPA